MIDVDLDAIVRAQGNLSREGKTRKKWENGVNTHNRLHFLPGSCLPTFLLKPSLRSIEGGVDRGSSGSSSSE